MVFLSVDEIISDVRRLFVVDSMSESEKPKKKAAKKPTNRSIVTAPNPSKKRKLDASGAHAVMQEMQNSLDNLREIFIPSTVSDIERMFFSIFRDFVLFLGIFRILRFLKLFRTLPPSRLILVNSSRQFRPARMLSWRLTK